MTNPDQAPSRPNSELTHPEATPSQLAQSLRARGYAVVFFNPDELEGVDPRRVESRLVEVGNEVIAILQNEYPATHDRE